MGPKKGTKAYREEYITAIYGINPRTKKVQSVYASRDGMLTGERDDRTPIRHPIKPGWAAKDEARLIFGLREVFSVPIALVDSEHTKRKIEELEAKASECEDEP